MRFYSSEGQGLRWCVSRTSSIDPLGRDHDGPVVFCRNLQSHRMTFTALERPNLCLSLRRSIRRPVFANNLDAVLIRILLQAPTSESWPLPNHYTQEDRGEEAEERHHSKEPVPAIQWGGDQYQRDTHQPAPTTPFQGRMKNGKARDKICR